MGASEGKTRSIRGSYAPKEPFCGCDRRDTDFAQRAVIFHDTVRRRGGVAVLIGSLAAGIGGIAPGGILGGVIDDDGGFYAAAGHQLCAALIASGNVGVVVTIAQPQDGIVVT